MYTKEEVLKPIFSSQKSFNKNAYIITESSESQNEQVIRLRSYNTIVAAIYKNYATGESKCTVYGTYSVTTLKHIREFLKQHGFEVYPSAKLLEVYGE